MFQFFSFCDAPERLQIGFKHHAILVVEELKNYNNYLMFFSIVVGFFLCFVLYTTIYNFRGENKLIPQLINPLFFLRAVLTVSSSDILLGILLPVLWLYFTLNDLINPGAVLRNTCYKFEWGHKDNNCVDSFSAQKLTFGFFTVLEDKVCLNHKRPLELDHRVLLPVFMHIRLLITSADVLHSWAIPSFGIKVDACPGRLSQVSLFIKRTGVYYGQCSEICGVNHGFMLIVVKGVISDLFTSWIFKKLDSFKI